MKPEEQHAAAAWHLLQKLKKATLNPPANYPVQKGEEQIYDIDVTSADEVNHLKKLHYSGTITIVDPQLTGFTSPRKFPIVVSMGLGDAFEKSYTENLAGQEPTHISLAARLDKRHNQMLLVIEGTEYPLSSLRSGSDPDKLFDWLMNNADVAHKFSAVKFEANCISYKQHSYDLALRLSHSKLVRDYFLPVKTKQEIKLVKEKELGPEEILELINSVSETKK